MRKYGGLFLISSLLLASCNSPAVVPPEPKPEPKPVLQIAAGTFFSQLNQRTGTSLLVNVALSDGTALPQDTEVTVTGPADWNQGSSQELTVYGKHYSGWLLTTVSPPVAGVYKVSATIAGQTYTATSGQVNPAVVLDAAAPITVKDDGTQVTVKWPPVNGAALYLHRVVPVEADAFGERDNVAAANIATRTGQVTFPSSALTPKTAYDIGVLAFSTVVDPKKNMTVPTQFNTSSARSAQPFMRNP